MALPENENGNEQQGPVIRDKRRIDPDTGELRTPQEDASAPEAEEAEEEVVEIVEGEPIAAEEIPAIDDTELGTLREELTERTNDLKRLQAEYVNYRRRVERDRVVVREQALGQVLGELLPILDDIGRARSHDELTGGFKSVGEALETVVAKLGLKKYAEQGDEFDPNVHEALTLVPSPEVSVPTVMEVFQPGYLIGERVMRPARVVVAGPADEEPAAPAGEAAPAPEAAESDAAEATEPPAAGKE